MKSNRSRFSYRRAGLMAYDVLTREGQVVGTVWKSRYGWSGRTASNRLVVEDYPGSRGVAAGVVNSENEGEQS